MKINTCWMMALASALMFVGCSSVTLPENWRDRAIAGGSAAVWTAISNGAPARVCVYMGAGVRDDGAFKVLRGFETSTNFVTRAVGAHELRSGILDFTDLLVFPGCDTAVTAENLGPQARDAIRSFVRRGGSFLGISGGARLALGDTPADLALAPFTDVTGNKPRLAGMTTIEMHYTNTVQQLTGKKFGDVEIRFDDGPVFLRIGDTDTNRNFQVLARFNGNVATLPGNFDLPSIGGHASVVAGTFGAGRVWLFSAHPEMFAGGFKQIAAATTYLTRHKPTFTTPQRQEGQLTVGWCAVPAPGAASAETALALNAATNIDLFPLGKGSFLFGMLTHVDALVLPDCPDSSLDEFLADPFYAKELADFSAHGGRIIDLRKTPDPFPELNALASAPPAAKRSPFKAAKKAAKPIRAVFYGAAGGGGCGVLRVARQLAASTNYVVRFVEGADVRAGALDSADLYIAPGGESNTQAANLGKDGCAKLIQWIRNGGIYHGTCAGAYLVSQWRPGVTNNCSFLQLMPFYAQRCAYRGGNALVPLKFTPAGTKALGATGTRSMFYHGGPILLPGKPVADSAYDVLATFDCQNVYVYNTYTAPAMSGAAAIVAGRFGKGKVLAMSPHPEADDGTEDLVSAEIGFLTGRPLDGPRAWRTRGNLTVGFFSNRFYNDGGTLGLELIENPDLDVIYSGGRGCETGDLEHTDVMVVPHPRKATIATFDEFLNRGGKVYTWYTNDKEKSYLPKDRKNLFIFDSGKACGEALAKYAASRK